MSNKKFIMGSQAFFKDYKDFTPGDIDKIEFEENPKLYKEFLQIRSTDKTKCYFKWRLRSADEFIEYMLKSKVPMELGKFLVPEIAEYLGITIEHLKKLQPIINSLDDKHLYEKIIWESYIKNNGFYLTQEQKDNAYLEYKKYRN